MRLEAKVVLFLYLQRQLNCHVVSSKILTGKQTSSE